MGSPQANYDNFPSFPPPSPAEKPPSHLAPPPPPHKHSPPPPSPSPDSHPTVIVIVFVSLGGLFFLAFLSVALCCFIKKRKKKMVQETDIINIDEHMKVKEVTVPGPHGTQAVVLSIDDDVHIQEEMRKNDKFGEEGMGSAIGNRVKKMAQETDMLNLDEHLKVKEAIVEEGPHGGEVAALSMVDDVNIQEEIRKEEKGKMNQGTDMVNVDQQVNPKEAVVGGPQGAQTVALSIVEDDSHFEEEIKKNEKLCGGGASSAIKEGESSSISGHHLGHKG